MAKHPSAFGYYGGKGKIIDFIHSHIPANPKGNFLDLFGGSGVVSFSMINRFHQIVYNDIEGRLCRFFRTLRDSPQDVYDAISLTPASREDFEACWEPSDDPIEDARRVFVRVNSSFMKKGLWSGPGGWQFHGMQKNRSTAKFLRGKLAALPEVAAMLESIDIENRCWRELIPKATDHTTIFADPPYDLESRSGGKGYENEMTEQDHRNLFSMLSESPANSFVCGYRSTLYDDLYKDWELVQKPLNNNYNATAGEGSSSRKVECIWINPKNRCKTSVGLDGLLRSPPIITHASPTHHHGE